ncbi:TPA: toxin-activating lysine-acyltransferase [Yersinia enterocolitica]|nr:toxin-activating lysine-acyltransferase [Yersinia enterocolitica]CAJ90393.1 putative RTX activating protein RtxC [Yersinia enterocolitica (type O:3)]ADZ41775.1 Cytolysin-activating lysine-acyltransferase rtxC [Yersinia enterocolitica subsp. palearctica 105.5R(r)]KGA73032.1 RTX toxin acyltransferase family protein [Yersinia enterocolitica]KGA74661.1 RTX toxin acyltransferase family protein [Yersinia enterocolitica]MCE3063095.1 toxin-activating lysine-acyltransferase [Yersinia enterocolitica]
MINNKFTSLESSEIQKIMGGVMLLTQRSPLHRAYFVSEWFQQIYPAIILNQFRYYEDEQGNPLAFCNWAFLSEKNMNEILSGERDIRKEDWQSGSNMFFPEMIAPYGHAKMMVNDLRKNIHSSRKGEKVCAIRGQLNKQCSSDKPKIQWFKI